MQSSLEPVTPTSWLLADGKGKSRLFKGYASGTRVWVRFASTRGQSTSDWSPMTSILIP